MAGPKISIIVPCYNSGEFLPETIDSVLAQSWTDYEIIIVDDCSDDGTSPAIIAEQVKRDQRIRVITHSENCGLAGSRNTGIADARGDYILPLDADDLLAVTFLQKHLTAIEQQNADVAYCHYQCFGKMKHTVRLPSNEKKVKAKLPYRNVFTATSMFRRADWQEFGGYDARLRSQEDWDFWLNYAGTDKKLVLVDEVLFYYRTHASSLFNRTLHRRAKNHKTIKNNHPELYKWKNYYLNKNYFRFVLRRALLQIRLRKGRRVVRVLGIYLIRPK